MELSVHEAASMIYEENDMHDVPLGTRRKKNMCINFQRKWLLEGTLDTTTRLHLRLAEPYYVPFSLYRNIIYMYVGYGHLGTSTSTKSKIHVRNCNVLHLVIAIGLKWIGSC